MTKFYKVSNIETDQGLWYDQSGNFTGLIHNKFNFCKNNQLLMNYDPQVIGYLSATNEFNNLFHWFSKEDILKLQSHNYFIHEYYTDNFKWYNIHE